MADPSGTGVPSPVTDADVEAVHRQLGRPPRDIAEVAHRCPCGEPDVLRTKPRLADGTPFPTSFYATCPRLTGAISTLESEGVMREMSERLAVEEDLADLAVYEALLAHRGIRGLVVVCDDCQEDHYHDWDMLRANLLQLLIDGTVRPHEPRPPR